MRKAKFLVAALAVAIMLMGAGYAYWTQTVTINNTVSTGYLDVQFVDSSEFDWDDGPVIVSDLVGVDSDISEDGQNLEFTVTNFYPGAGAKLDFAIKNTGTVNAKVASVTGTVIENQALADVLEFKVDTVKVFKLFGIPIFYYIEPVEAHSVSELAAKLSASGIKDIVLEPGDELVLLNSADPGYHVLMPSSITGDDFEDETVKFDLGINFVQVNR